MIALWLGHESVETTQIYLEATLAMKEQALAKTTPPNGRAARYWIAPISSRLSTTGNRSGVRARTTGGTAPISMVSTALYRNSSAR